MELLTLVRDSDFDLVFLKLLREPVVNVCYSFFFLILMNIHPHKHLVFVDGLGGRGYHTLVISVELDSIVGVDLIEVLYQ